MATVRTWIAPHRLLVPALLIALIALGPARPAHAQQPPQAGAQLPDEEDGSFTDNEDPADVSSGGSAAPVGVRVVAPPSAPCPLVGAAVVVPPGPPSPCP